MRIPGALTHRQRMDRAVSESSVQATITDEFTLLSWCWHHETDSRRSHRGLPDLNAWHPRSLWSVHVEVKREIGRLSVEQMRFLEAMGGPPLVGRLHPLSTIVHIDLDVCRIVAVARPSNLTEVVQAIHEASDV